MTVSISSVFFSLLSSLFYVAGSFVRHGVRNAKFNWTASAILIRSASRWTRESDDDTLYVPPIFYHLPIISPLERATVLSHLGGVCFVSGFAVLALDSAIQLPSGRLSTSIKSLGLRSRSRRCLLEVALNYEL